MKYFVAICPPLVVINEVGRMTAGWSGDRGLLVEPATRLHVTVRYMGQVICPGPLMAALGRKCEAAPPLTARYGPATVRLTRQALVVPVSGLRTFAEDMMDVTQRWGDVPARRPFIGHLTVARNRPTGHHGGSIPQAWVGIPVSGSWPVEAVCLFVSEVVAGAPCYRVVEEFPLAG